MGSIASALHRPLVRIAAVLGLALAFFAIAALQTSELKSERANYLYLMKTNYWALGQLGWELERFIGALDRYVLGAADIGFDTLSLRFDILWSRTPILLHGPETAEVRRIEGAEMLLKAFSETLAALEPDLLALRGSGEIEPYRRVRTALSAYRAPLHELTMELYMGPHSQQNVRRITESHRLSAIYQWSMLALVALLALHLALEVRYSNRQAHREKAARQAAEAAAKAKGRFLAVISHELRTPLNAILGFSDLQRAEAFGPVPERYRSYASDIYASAEHLLGVLNDVLDMVKLDTQKMKLHEEDFDPADAVHASIRMVEEACASAEVLLTTDIRTQGVLLRGDRHLFQQILLNLLSNAMRFTPAGGSIVVGLATAAGDLVVSVEDTGPGVPPEALDRLGQPFFQADQSHARRHQGIGLGLALVKGFAELHDGTVTIASEAGCGTRVAVRFPAYRVL